MNRLDFIKSLRPVPPFRDWRVYSLLVPAAFSAAGFFVFAILGYSFTEFSSIPAGVRFALVVAGGVCLSAGGELGTLTSTVEIYRKQKLDKVVGWDWFALGISLATTLSSFVLAFAALLGAKAGWSQPVQIWGAIFLGALSAVDAYGLFLELGYLLADYEQRVEDWFARLEQAQAAAPISASEFESVKQELERMSNEIEYSKYPVATLADFRRIVAGLNGQRKQFVGKPAREVVEQVCRIGGMRPPLGMSAQTFSNWAKEVEKRD